MPGLPTLTPDGVGRVRDDLAAAAYTVDGVQAALGRVGAAALGRNETTPGLRATGGGSPLETLVRLWPLQADVPAAAAAAALPASLGALLDGGLLTRSAEGAVRAVVDVRPYADDSGDWWVCADLTPRLDGVLAPVPADHVLGVSSASSTLAQLTVRPDVGRALDLGTGCGVQALHLSRHAASVVATDLSGRAISLAGLTAALNRMDLDLRRGDLYEPVAGERFDLVVSNPPFVVSPPRSGARHVYRDSGLAGDEVSRRVVVEGAGLLADGGWLQALANWVHLRGTDWRDRVSGWVDATGCDAWALQREVLDPAAYVELWLRDSGEVSLPDYRERYDRWLGWFDDLGVEGVGFGWVTLRRAGADGPVVRVEDWPHAVEQPLAPTVQATLERADELRACRDDDALLARRFVVAADVVQEQVGPPGAEDPEHVVLRQRRGLRRARRVGTAEAGLVGASDGSLPLGVLLDAVAAVLGGDSATLRADLLPRVRELVAEGFLLPA